jgi:hypothetical protein
MVSKEALKLLQTLVDQAPFGTRLDAGAMNASLRELEDRLKVGTGALRGLEDRLKVGTGWEGGGTEEWSYGLLPVSIPSCVDPPLCGTSS